MLGAVAGVVAGGTAAGMPLPGASEVAPRPLSAGNVCGGKFCGGAAVVGGAYRGNDAVDGAGVVATGMATLGGEVTADGVGTGTSPAVRRIGFSA